MFDSKFTSGIGLAKAKIIGLLFIVFIISFVNVLGTETPINKSDSLIISLRLP